MRRPLALLSLVALVAWLLPLGAFIKPSMEKTACDGKRAVHMCSAMSGGAEVKPEASAGPAFSSPSSPSKASSGSDAGNEFLVAQDALAAMPASDFRPAKISFRILHLISAIEHVPLAA